MTYDRTRVTRELRAMTTTIAQSVADYIDNQADYDGITPRELDAEIAMAYLAGYKYATGETLREAHKAVRGSGLWT